MNFSGYAESLPGTVLEQLYQSLYVCQAILHSLPPLAKQYVVRMLHAHAIPAGEQFIAWPCCLSMAPSQSIPFALQTGLINGVLLTRLLNTKQL